MSSSTRPVPSHNPSGDHVFSNNSYRRSGKEEESPRGSDSHLSSRLPSTRSFPTHLHHRQRNEERQTHAIRNAHAEERQHWPRRLFVDTSDIDSDKSRSKHRHSKSRDGRIPRTMNQIASAGGARSLLPTKTFSREKERYGNGSLLKPVATHDSSRSQWSSRPSSIISTGSRRGSLVDERDLNEKLNLVKRKEISTMEDLEKARQEREKGEESLRSTLSSIGSLATDITRRLDYTYYNLLERISTLYATLNSFQELADSSSALYDDFKSETKNMDYECRKQLEDFKGFEPQVHKIEALEQRMSAGREKVEALGHRLDIVRNEIDGWERREGEWQARISRRLRIMWAVMGTAIVVLVIAIVQNWPTPDSSSVAETRPRIDWPTQQSLNTTNPPSHGRTRDPYLEVTQVNDRDRTSWRPSYHETTETGYSQTLPTGSVEVGTGTISSGSNEEDPLRIFDEL